ncbi:MAG: NPCBM/NEW2 domain-containing protein [Planctomycetes bacterium]|nr:NPCBM/NEW2 domain-containing protein [Planctomycetota bacterium]
MSVAVRCPAHADGEDALDPEATPHVVATLIDSTQVEGRFEGIRDGQLSLATDSGVVRHPIDELGELRFLNPSSTPQNNGDASVVFFLADGGRLAGELLGPPSVGNGDTGSIGDRRTAKTLVGKPPVAPARTLPGKAPVAPARTLVGKPPVAPGGSKAGLRARLDVIGTVDLPFTALAGMRFARQAEHPDAESLFTSGLAERSTEHDLLISVREGRLNTASGALMSLSAAGGVFRFAGRDRPFRTDAVYAILLAAGIGSSGATAWSTPGAPGCRPSARVTLADGSSFGGMLHDGGRNELVIDTSFGARLSISINRVAQVRFRSDRIVYLSDLEPLATESEGITQSPWPVRMDRSASNGLIRLAGRVYDKGIGMHARAWIDFDADAAFTDLLVTIGIDDAVRPGGEAVFRVLGDDRTLYDSGIVTGRDPPLPIRIDIRGIRSLRLMADYGQELDLGAHANWADARFLRMPRGGVDVSAITGPSISSDG